eukprot:3359672-Amphidinium_carterae.1
MRTREDKSAGSASRSHEYLSLVAPVRGLTENGWAQSWLQDLRAEGLATPHSDKPLWRMYSSE